MHASVQEKIIHIRAIFRQSRIIDALSASSLLTAISIIALSMFTLSAHAEDKTPYNAQIQKKQSLLEKVKDSISSIHETVETKQEYIDRIQGDLKKEEKSISQLQNSLRKVKIDSTKLNSRLARMTGEEKALNRHLILQREQLAEQIRMVYLIGPQPYLKILLNQEHPRTISRMLTYYEYLHTARLKTIKEIEASLNKLDRKRAEITHQKVKLKTIHKRIVTKQVTLKTNVAKRKAVIDDIDNQLADKTAYLEKLHSDEQKLHGTLHQLQDSKKKYLATRSKFNRLKSRLSWPTPGLITKHFGDVLERQLKWNGVLIEAAEGQNVRSPASGKVIYSGWLRGFGFLMIVNHGQGFLTLYGRCQTLLKTVGEHVKANEKIARVGQTGGFLKSGLYFEVRHNGKPEDPETWCKRT